MATINKVKDEANYNQYANTNKNSYTQLDEYKALVNQNTSALSQLNNAKKQAVKYADIAAQAQGYSTQGAALQNMNTLQSAYMNQVSQQNQALQGNLVNLENKASANAFNQYQSALSNAYSTNQLTQEELNALQQAYYSQMSASDLTSAETFTRQLLTEQNKLAEQTQLANLGVDINTQQGVSIDAIKNANDDAKLSEVLGKGAGSNLYLGVLKDLVNSGTLKNGDVIGSGKNSYVYYNGSFYLSNTNLQPTYYLDKIWFEQNKK